MRMTDLMGRKGESDGQTFPVTEIFFHEPTGRLRYVALGTGGWLTREEVLVRADRFGVPEEGSSHWPVTLSAEHIEEAPTWHGGDASGPPIHLENWPPIVVGPFGGTTSPLMMWAELAESEHEDHRHGPSGDSRVAKLERASQRLGGEVFGSDGLLGTLADMTVDPETFEIHHFVVRAPDGDHARALRHAAPLRARRAPRGAEPRPQKPARDRRPPRRLAAALRRARRG